MGVSRTPCPLRSVTLLWLSFSTRRVASPVTSRRARGLPQAAFSLRRQPRAICTFGAQIVSGANNTLQNLTSRFCGPLSPNTMLAALGQEEVQKFHVVELRVLGFNFVIGGEGVVKLSIARCGLHSAHSAHILIR